MSVGSNMQNFLLTEKLKAVRSFHAMFVNFVAMPCASFSVIAIGI
jgi:hypothetical protein